VMTSLPWPCEIRERFLPSNRGLGPAVSGALDWFFSHETHGIVLEDDILPAHDFLPYCTELLERYARDSDIMSIAGSRFALPARPDAPSYTATRIFDCHGWASWRRAWNRYRFDIRDWRVRAGPTPLKHIGAISAKYWARRFDAIARENPPRNWARQFHLAHFLADGRCLVPRVNLVSHISTASDSTNLAKGFLWNDNPTGRLDWPLRHPDSTEPDQQLETWQEAWRHGHRRWVARKFWQMAQRWTLGSLAFRRGGVGHTLPRS
jgi:hypothetical protein